MLYTCKMTFCSFHSFFYLHYTVWWREENTVGDYTRHCAHSCGELCGAMVVPLICKASCLVLDWKLVWTLQTKWSTDLHWGFFAHCLSVESFKGCNFYIPCYWFICLEILNLVSVSLFSPWRGDWWSMHGYFHEKKVSIHFIIINSCLVSLRSNYSLNILH